MVDFEDVDGVTTAIATLLDLSDDQLKTRFDEARQALSWAQAAKPLIKFCQSPTQAPDKIATNNLVGTPFYQQQIDDLRQQVHNLQAESNGWQAKVVAYEQGRFIRFMRWLKRATG